MNIEALIKIAGKILDKRRDLDPKYQEIAKFICPERALFGASTKNSDVENREEIFDSTPEEASDMLTAALHNLLTNPATAWFSLDINYGKDEKEVLNWLTEVSRIMLDLFNDAKTGFGSEVNSCYSDLVNFGWAVLYVEEDADLTGTVKFLCVPPSECAISQDSFSRVDSVVRTFKMTADNLVSSFGDLPNDFKDKAKNDSNYEYEILHLVLPTAKVKNLGFKVNEKYKFASFYLERNTKTILREGGFYELPYLVPRWARASGDVYGRGPGFAALPDIRVLNAVACSQLMAAEKQSDPPLLVPNDSDIGKIRTNAGDITYYNPISGQITPLPVATDLSAMQLILEGKRDAIRTTFLNDRIQLAGGPQMTATEASIREQKQMTVLGPVLGRLQAEFLGPLVERVFGILYRAARLPDAPEILQGQELQTRYISPIARAQKQSEILAFSNTIAYLSSIVQFNPQVLDNFNFDEVARDTQELFGYPAKYLVDEKLVMEMRKQAQEQAAQAQAMAQMQQLAEAVPDE